MDETKRKSYYEVLGISKDDDLDAIKKAYRKLALRWHPDKNDGCTEAAEKFKELAEAFTILSDPEQRKLYDDELKGAAAGLRRRWQFSATMEARIAQTMRETKERLRQQNVAEDKNAGTSSSEGIDWCMVIIVGVGSMIAFWVAVR
eukprot:TRINITY_DN4078_c1_g2_i1.p2 TRINITY_DN4078_c1_g2~~TRINITY_DN4078_c1_g2_i1.p2  ORF type:complete len:146 (-),score=39.62 TRINITY_DN4078_c1_g2_i1:158-595(-)